MLKKCLTVALALAFPATVGAQTPTPPSAFVVGSVRDQEGAPLEAEVEVVDTTGKKVGLDHTQADGTFAVTTPQSGPLWVLIHCRFCARTRVPTNGQAPLVIIVRRYVAIAQRLADNRDIQALPYSEVGDDLALSPYVIPKAIGATITDISDRGLDRGRGLILDDGAPVYDLATGSSRLLDIPSRYGGTTSAIGPEHAFAYGGYAAGGIFGLAPRTQTTEVSVDGGIEPSFAAHIRSNDLFTALGASRNADGIVRERDDLSYETNFAGGRLESSAANASLSGNGVVPDRSSTLGHISYATASQKYRTSISVGGSTLQSSLLQTGIPLGSRSSDLFSSLKIEHPGPLTLVYGAFSQRLTGVLGTTLSGQIADDLAYVEAKMGAQRSSIDAGASISQISTTTRSGAASAQHAAAQFGQYSLSGHTALGRWFDLQAAASSAGRVPTLAEIAAQLSPSTANPERSDLIATTLAYEDTRRIRFEATALREALHSYGDRTTSGIGASVAWQIAPLVSLRVWTLRNDVEAYGAPSIYAPYTSTTLAESGPFQRGVLWSTYDNPSGLRIDAILHHDASSTQTIANLDGSLLIPLTASVKLWTGSYRTNEARRWSVGLRF